MLDELWKLEQSKVAGFNVKAVSGEVIASGLAEDLATRICKDHNRRIIARGEVRAPDDVVLAAQLETLRDFHMVFVQFMSYLDGQVRAGKLTQEQEVDIGFLFRETENLLDDWRKDAKARKEKISSILSQRVIQKAIANADGDMTVHGKIARAVCDVENIPALPKRDINDPSYIALCEHFKVPKELIGTKVFKLDFGEVTKLVNEVAAGQRKKIPGLGRTYQQFTAVYTKLKIKDTVEP